MKQIIIRAIPIVTAIILVAFTQIEESPKDKAVTYSDCYWFYCTNNILQPILCTVTTLSCDICPDICDGGTYCCAKAYSPQDTEVYLDGATCKRRPKPNASAQNICYKSTP